METFAGAVLLFTALALPVVLFLLFRPRSRLHGILATVVAVAAGWSFNVAYMVATEAIAAKAATQANSDNIGIAVTYGWACPLVLVLLTWLAWHFVTRRSA